VYWVDLGFGSHVRVQEVIVIRPKTHWSLGVF